MTVVMARASGFAGDEPAVRALAYLDSDAVASRIPGLSMVSGG